MKNLIIIGHPYKKSFCYNGIFKTIFNEINKSDQELEVIDLYRDSFSRPRTKLIEKYKNLVLWSERIYIISPVWWFRLTPRMEVFLMKNSPQDLLINLLMLQKLMHIQNHF